MIVFYKWLRLTKEQNTLTSHSFCRFSQCVNQNSCILQSFCKETYVFCFMQIARNYCKTWSISCFNNALETIQSSTDHCKNNVKLLFAETAVANHWKLQATLNKSFRKYRKIQYKARMPFLEACKLHCDPKATLTKHCKNHMRWITESSKHSKMHKNMTALSTCFLLESESYNEKL